MTAALLAVLLVASTSSPSPKSLDEGTIDAPERSTVKRIEIAVRETSLHSEPSETTTITEGKDGFVDNHGRPISQERVDRLSRAIQEPARGFSPIELGIDQAWLDNHADEAVRLQSLVSTPRQIALYRRAFRNVAFMRSFAANAYLDQSWTDDYPAVTTRVFYADGSEIAASSREQRAYMLPWVIHEPGTRRTTYNVELSKTIAALLPSNALNRDRLDGQALLQSVSDWLYDKLDRELDEAAMQDTIPMQYLEIRRHYRVTNDSIGCFGDLDAGKCPEWIGFVGTVAFPKNVDICATLPLRKGKVQSLSLLPPALSALQEAIAIPWLHQYIASNPKAHVCAEVTASGSFGPVARQMFKTDMAAIGRSPQSATGYSFDDALQLTIDDEGAGARLLVFPSGDSILWSWDLREISHFALRPLPCRRRILDQCDVGTVIGPDGVVRY